ncbi:MAG: hypothetical protein NVSMB17_10110 [Candidatus Dormibacteria bacterium]
MRLTAARLLNVFPGAVVVASMIIFSGVPAEAAPATAAAAPAPFVVAIDPGHGGSPDNSHPERLFDPGSVSGSGLLEKDLNLDVSKRIQHRLESDKVKVVMTRSTDRYVGIQERMTQAVDARAEMFISVHFNFFQDPAVGGAVLLYPREADQGVAQGIADALAMRLRHFPVPPGTVMLRENLWAHSTMPVVTIEAAYLTNKTEAELLTTENFREAIAAGIANGIESQLPGIPARKAQILKYNAAPHAAAAHGQGRVNLPALPPAPHYPVVQLVLLAAVGYLAVRYRRASIPALAFAMAIGSVLHSRVTGSIPDPRTRRGVRRRRSRAPIWTGARPY